MDNEKVLLFDLGKVIFDFDHMIAAKRITPYCAVKKEDIFELFFDSGLTSQYEKGEISSGDFFVRVKNALSADITFEQFISIWTEIFRPVAGMLEVLDALKLNYRLYMLSNINQLHFQYLQNNFPEYFIPFEYLFLSYELGLRKPDPRIYQRAADYIQKTPSSIIYTDDRADLIESARNLGFDAFVFESKDQFIKQLDYRGIALNSIIGNKI